MQKGARFTPKRLPATRKGAKLTGFGSIYLGLDEGTPLREVSGVLKPAGSPVPLLFEPQVLMTVDGVLTDILDVSDRKVQKALGTTLQELTGHWVIQQEDYIAGKGPLPPTQVLGQAAYDAGGITGLKYASSKNPTDGFGIVVFSDRLAPGRSRLEVLADPKGHLAQTLP